MLRIASARRLPARPVPFLHRLRWSRHYSGVSVSLLRRHTLHFCRRSRDSRVKCAVGERRQRAVNMIQPYLRQAAAVTTSAVVVVLASRFYATN